MFSPSVIIENIVLWIFRKLYTFHVFLHLRISYECIKIRSLFINHYPIIHYSYYIVPVKLKCRLLHTNNTYCTILVLLYLLHYIVTIGQCGEFKNKKNLEDTYYLDKSKQNIVAKVRSEFLLTIILRNDMRLYKDPQSIHKERNFRAADTSGLDWTINGCRAT